MTQCQNRGYVIKHTTKLAFALFYCKQKGDKQYSKHRTQLQNTATEHTKIVLHVKKHVYTYKKTSLGLKTRFNNVNHISNSYKLIFSNLNDVTTFLQAAG